ncbi:MAG: hypothetical protein ABI476_01610 [Oxalobacteraceae bacterium]
MRSINYAVKVIWALAICAPGLAVSAELSPDDAPLQQVSVVTESAEPAGITAVTPVSIKAETAPVFIVGMGPALSADRLDGYRGGTETVINDMTLSGTVARNSATDVSSGNNILTGAAFANTSGFATAIQNSGSNVLIQNATIVNVQFQ